MMRRRRSDAGFTLIEALVGLAIMAVVLGAMVLARPDAGGVRVGSAARAVAALLRTSRAQAMARNAEMLVWVDPQARRFGAGTAEYNLPAGSEVMLTVAATEQRDDRGAFRFYPDGQSSGGTLSLRLGAHAVRVSVDWLTGQPRVEP